MKILTIATSNKLTCATLWQQRGRRMVAEQMREALRLGDAIGSGLDGTELIVASGTIASESPRLAAPSGLAELAAGMFCGALAETGAQPVWFIPGIGKQGGVGLHNCEASDGVAGEETAAMGLIERMEIREPTVAVFAGARSKFVHLDGGQRVAGVATSLSGKLFEALLTITATQAEPGDSLDAEMLEAGASHGRDYGLGRIAVLVRQLETFCPYGRSERLSFLLGAVLGADLQTLKNSRALRINPTSRFVIAGEPRLAEAFETLIAADGFFSGPVSVVAEGESSLANRGALAVARRRGLIPG